RKMQRRGGRFEVLDARAQRGLLPDEPDEREPEPADGEDHHPDHDPSGGGHRGSTTASRSCVSSEAIAAGRPAPSRATTYRLNARPPTEKKRRTPARPCPCRCTARGSRSPTCTRGTPCGALRPRSASAGENSASDATTCP